VAAAPAAPASQIVRVDVEPRGAAPTEGKEDPTDRGADPMRYMLLLYDNDDTRDAFFGPGSEPLGEEMDALLKELKDSGELVATDPLADPAQTRTVRVSGGAPVVTDGPLAEAKEHFGGYLIVDCESIERAVEIAARWPSARFAPLEVRPIMDVGGLEM
jgi:hypothetical protein